MHHAVERLETFWLAVQYIAHIEYMRTCSDWVAWQRHVSDLNALLREFNPRKEVEPAQNREKNQKGCRTSAHWPRLQERSKPHHITTDADLSDTECVHSKVACQRRDNGHVLQRGDFPLQKKNSKWGEFCFGCWIETSTKGAPSKKTRQNDH